MSGTLQYGLNPGGFNRRRAPESRAALYENLLDRTGLQFDETPRSVIGQIASILADRDASLWELGEAVYYSRFPGTAVGVSLDLAVSFAGVRRVQDAPSRITAILYGAQGTVVEAGAVVESTFLPSGESAYPRAALQAAVTIDRANAAFVSARFPSPVPANTTFWIDSNGSRRQVTSGPTGGNAAALAEQLGAQFGAQGFYYAVKDTNRLEIYNPIPFSVAVSNTLVTEGVGTVGVFEALTPGPIEFPTRSLTRIITGVSGWNGVSNEVPADRGTIRETDEALRLRYDRGVYRLGAATLPAIRANMEQEPEGVTFVAVNHNVGDVNDAEGRPPHSVEVVIEGGDVDVVARYLFDVVAAGIPTFGNTTRYVIDETGYPNAVSFSRPEIVWAWIKYTITKTSEEEPSGNMEDLAVEAMVEEGQSFGPGFDVLIQRLEAAVFDRAQGVKRVRVLVALTPPNAPAPADNAYQAGDLVIGSRQRADFDASRVRTGT